MIRTQDDQSRTGSPQGGHARRRAGALFFWLLRERKCAFITQHDEDEAARRLREHLNGPAAKRRRTESPAAWTLAQGQDEGSGGGEEVGSATDPADEMTDEHRFVVACIRVAKQHRGLEPFDVARMKGWTPDRFDRAHTQLQAIELRRWRPTGEPIEEWDED